MCETPGENSNIHKLLKPQTAIALRSRRLLQLAGFGSDFGGSRLAVGGAQTKMRFDSMEKIFCSQGLASPIEPAGGADCYYWCPALVSHVVACLLVCIWDTQSIASVLSVSSH